MGALSFTHLLIIVLILLLFFGPTKLPQLGQSLGKAIRGFKEGLNEIDAEVKEVKTPPSDQQRSQISSAGSVQNANQNEANAAQKSTDTDKNRA